MQIRAWSAYIVDGKVYIPSRLKTEAGFFIESEPVSIEKQSDLLALEKTLSAIIQRSIPTVPTPNFRAAPKPFLHKYAAKKSNKQFEGAAKYWSIEFDGNTILLIPGIRRENGGWLHDNERALRIEVAGNFEEAIRRLTNELCKS